jgi:hypothetical protein
MKITQIRNIYMFMGIMLLDNKLLSTSPDYFEEKAKCFFGKLGKNEFVEFSKPKYFNATDDNFHKSNFWKVYRERWKIDDNDFELINIINFLLNVRPPFDNKGKSDMFKYFEKFIGNIETIPYYDNSGHAHFKIAEYINKHIDFNDRLFKLKILQTL